MLIDRGAATKTLGHSTRKNKCNNLEPHFPTSATKPRSLDDTKTAAALPHCSASTRDSIAGKWTFLLEVTPELWRYYGKSYVKQTKVEVFPVVDLSGKSAFQIFLWAMQHRCIYLSMPRGLRLYSWHSNSIAPVRAARTLHHGST